MSITNNAPDIRTNAAANFQQDNCNQITYTKQEIQNYIDEKKELYNILLEFIENLDDDEINFNNLINYMNTRQLEQDRENFNQFLQLITNIANNHHRGKNLFQKIFRIIKNYQVQIKKTFSNLEIFKLFKINKKILLFLFENEILKLDNTVYQELINTVEPNGNRLCYFFYPEIKVFNGGRQIEEIEKEILSIDSKIFDHFDEKRHIGENDSYLCCLIRYDSIDDFISYIARENISLTSPIKPSIFETNSFLIENHEITLVEYSAFYGSIQIFQYIALNHIDLKPSLILYSIHSRNKDLIHIIESYENENISHEKRFIESIKCHHNEIANYIKTNFLPEDADKRSNHEIASAIIQFHNYSYFSSELRRYEFFYFCLYKYNKIIDLCIQNNMKNILKLTEQNNQIDVIYYNLSKQTSIHKYTFKINARIKEIAIPPSITHIYEYSFHSFRSLKRVIIPSSVIYIGDDAFSDCVSLQMIIIPSSVTQLGSCAFSNCRSLKEVTFETPSSLASISIQAFECCSSLKQITIPYSVTNIESQAFYECSLLAKVTIPSSITSIGESAFAGCLSLKQIEIPPSVTSIESNAFNECSSLIQVTIPSSIRSIEQGVFAKCSSLKQIEIPPSVTKIGDRAFSQCFALTHVKIPPSVTSIGNSAFSQCSSLEQIEIPPSVTSIGNSAFSQCSSLDQIEIPPSVTSIGHDAFSECPAQVKLPSANSIRDNELALK